MNTKHLLYVSCMLMGGCIYAGESEGIFIKIPTTFSIAPAFSRDNSIRSLALFTGCTGALLLKKGVEQLCATPDNDPVNLTVQERSSLENKRFYKSLALTGTGLSITAASVLAIIYSNRFK